MHTRTTSRHCFIFAAIGLSVFSSTAASAFEFSDLFNFEETDPSKLVTVEARYSPKLCSEEYPLWVLIKNGSEKKIRGTKFSVIGRLPNYSNSQYSVFDLYTDRIIAPQDEHALCWKAPTPAIGRAQNPIDEMIWETKDVTVYFEQ